MLRKRLLPYLFALAVLPLLAFIGQDKLTPEQEQAAAGLTAQFASLRYTTASGQDQTVLSKTLTKIQLVQSEKADTTWLELFFHNGDYVYVKVDSVTFYQGTRGIQTNKVLVTRVTKDHISFPRIIP